MFGKLAYENLRMQLYLSFYAVTHIDSILNPRIPANQTVVTQPERY